MARNAKNTTPLLSLLSDAQRDMLASYCVYRIDSLAASMNTWREARKRYCDTAENKFDWRKGERGDRDSGKDIFNVSNESLNIVGGFASYMTAKTSDDIF